MILDIILIAIIGPLSLSFCIFAFINMPKKGPAPPELDTMELKELMSRGLSIKHIVHLQVNKHLSFEEIKERHPKQTE